MAAIICIKESQLREVVEMPEIDLKKFKFKFMFDSENLEEYIIKLKKSLKELEDKMLVLAEKMHNIRVRNSEKISVEINNRFRCISRGLSGAGVHIFWQQLLQPRCACTAGKSGSVYRQQIDSTESWYKTV